MSIRDKYTTHLEINFNNMSACVGRHSQRLVREWVEP